VHEYDRRERVGVVASVEPYVVDVAGEIDMVGDGVPRLRCHAFLLASRQVTVVSQGIDGPWKVSTLPMK